MSFDVLKIAGANTVGDRHNDHDDVAAMSARRVMSAVQFGENLENAIPRPLNSVTMLPLMGVGTKISISSGLEERDEFPILVAVGEEETDGSEGFFSCEHEDEDELLYCATNDGSYQETEIRGLAEHPLFDDLSNFEVDEAFFDLEESDEAEESASGGVNPLYKVANSVFNFTSQMFGYLANTVGAAKEATQKITSSGTLGIGRYFLAALKTALKDDSLETIVKDDNCQQVLELIDPENQLDIVASKVSEALVSDVEAEICKKLYGEGSGTARDTIVREFLEVYQPQLAKQILYNLAIQNTDEIPENPQQLLLHNIVKNLLSALHCHFDVESISDMLSKFRVMEVESNEETKKRLTAELRQMLAPVSNDLLQASGINCIEDLRFDRVSGLSQAVKYYLGARDGLGLLASEILPDQLIKILRLVDHTSILTIEAQIRVDQFSGQEMLPQVVDSAAEALLPRLKQQMELHSHLLTQPLANSLGVTQSSLEPLVSLFAGTANSSVDLFWKLFKNSSVPVIVEYLKAMALPNPLGHAIGQRPRSPDNFAERVILNLTKVMHASIHGQDAALAAKAAAYERIEVLVHLLKSAKKYAAARTVEERRGGGPSTACIDQILSDANIGVEKRQDLIASIKIFFDHSVVGTDEELLQRFLFGLQSNSDVDGNTWLAVIDGSLAKACQRCESVLCGTFGGLEIEFLRLLGLDTSAAWDNTNLSLVWTYEHFKTKLLPPLLLGLYRDFALKESDLQIDLQVLLFNQSHTPEQRVILRDILQRGDAANDYDREFLNQAGVANVADLLGGTFSVVAEDIQEVVKHFLSSNDGVVEILKAQLLEMPGMTEEIITPLLQGLSCAFASDDPSMNALFGYIQNNIETGLLKVLINIGNTVEHGSNLVGEALNNEVIGRGLLEIFKRFNAHKVEIARVMRTSPEIGSEAFRTAFRGIVLDLINFTGLNSRDIPGSEAFREVIWQKLLNDILPDFLGKMYLQTTSLEIDNVRAANEDALADIYGTRHPQEAIGAIAQFAAESVQSYAALHPDAVSATLLSSMRSYLSRSSSVGEGLQSRDSAIVELLGRNVAFAVQPGQTIDSTLDSSKEYIYSVLTTAFTNFSENIQRVDTAFGSEFLKDAGFKIIEFFHNHVMKINAIRTRREAENAYDVDGLKMLKDFAIASDQQDVSRGLVNLSLHPLYLQAKRRLNKASKALEKAKTQHSRSVFLPFTTSTELALSRAEVNYESAVLALSNLRKELYFEPLAKKILGLVNLNETTFSALPEPLKANLWNLFEKNLLPSLLDNMCLNLMRPETLNSIMHTVITSMHQTLDRVEAHTDVGGESSVALNAEEQSRQALQNAQCGSTISELLSLFPQTMSKSIFDMERVRSYAEPAIGEAFRELFGARTMIQAIDDMLFSALPALLPGTEWRLEPGDATGDERISFAPVEGERSSGTSRRSFGLPLTAAHHDRLEQERIQHETSMPSNLKKMLVQTLSMKIQELIASKLMSPWETMCKDVLDYAKENFSPGWDIKIAKILDGIKDFWMLLLNVTLILPVYKHVIWPLIEWKVLSDHADQIIRNFHMTDVHEQLLFASMNYFIEELEQRVVATRPD